MQAKHFPQMNIEPSMDMDLDFSVHFFTSIGKIMGGIVNWEVHCNCLENIA